jgi:hypothetical protein
MLEGGPCALLATAILLVLVAVPKTPISMNEPSDARPARNDIPDAGRRT